MAKAIPLPRYEELPDVVLFHRSHPSDQKLLMHVPTGPDGGETYIIRLNQDSAEPGNYDPRTDHKGWIKRLENSRGLMDRLAIDMHVAYYPKHGGFVMPLEDPDELPWTAEAFALARRDPISHLDKKLRERKLRTRMAPAFSPLRSSLSSRPGRASW